MDFKSELQLKLDAEVWKFLAEKAIEQSKKALDMVEVLLKQRDELGEVIVIAARLIKS